MHRRWQTRLRAFLMLSALPTLCAAGIQTGTVGDVIIRQSDGLVYFYLSGTATGKPACATGSYWIIKDENSNAGKQIIAALLAANAQGTTVTVEGFNTCTRWPNGEDVLRIIL